MQGFAEFAEAETPKLLGLAFVLTGNEHDAWDLVQESLVRVGLRWRRLAAENPAGYVRTTLVRLNIDRIRRLRRERPTAEVRTDDVPVQVVQPIDPWLFEALRELSPHQRAAVALRVFEDLDHRGIADLLGCSEGTARSHPSRGLSKMRELAATRAKVEES